MRRNFEIEVEIPAITLSIKKELAYPYIVSYAKQLEDCTFPNEIDKMIYLVQRILDWYLKHMDTIMSENLLFDYKVHKENQINLKKLLKILESEVKV